MPSFILRDLNPEFWSQVQAKAARDGITVKALILRLLTVWLAAVLVLVLTAGAPASPTAPSEVTPTPAAVPHAITLTSTSGFGNTYGQVFVVAVVTDATGRGVSTPVTFTTTAGTMRATVISDQLGQAQVTVFTTTAATVTATASTAVGSLAVMPLAAPVPGAPPSSPAPPPSSPTGPIAIVLEPLTATIGVSALLKSTPLLGGVAASSFTWDFGDGAHVISASSGAAHTYTALGSYTATVIVSAVDGRTASSSATVTVIAVPVPAPPPVVPPTLSVSVLCQPATHGSPTPCNVAATYGETPVPSNHLQITWDFGDGRGGTTAPSPLGSNTYSQAGRYLVTVQVRAETNDGPKLGSASQSIVIP